MAPHFFKQKSDHHHNQKTEDELSSQLSRLTSGDETAANHPTSILSTGGSGGSTTPLRHDSLDQDDNEDEQPEGCGGVPGSSCRSKPLRPKEARATSSVGTSSGAGPTSLTHSDTMSSTSSSSSSHPTSGSSTHGSSSSSKLSSLALSSIVKGHHGSSTHSSKHSSPSAPEPFILPRDPIALCEAAMSSILTIPGPPIEQLKKEIWPQLFHIAYEHRVNTREVNLDGLVAIVEFLRGRYQSARLRFRSHLMDMDGTATMKRAAVGIVYEIIVQVKHSVTPHKYHSHINEVRTSAMGVVKIFQGRLAQSDLVIDTAPLQKAAAPENQPDLSCTIM
ncbi:BQ2448_2533 [Microbotryum intermedium]|uniref:BQ2448_2533 protein n=1 Tax=Microbotryum intermedium TaxID=269621 RepID=A0A238FBY5_9BASI|nr:BQ2448_2533 [Microbotryum intermedium]